MKRVFLAILPSESVSKTNLLDCSKVVKAFGESSAPVSSFYLLAPKEYISDSDTKDLIDGQFRKIEKFGNKIDCKTIPIEHNLDYEDALKISRDIRVHLQKNKIEKVATDSTFLIHQPNEKHHNIWEDAIDGIIPENQIEYVIEEDGKIIKATSFHDKIKEITEKYVHVSDHIKGILNQVVELALDPNPKPLLIMGDVGSGKSILAEIYGEIRKLLKEGLTWHREDVSTLPQDTVSFRSELFGHKKGSFTGADNNRDGLVKRFGEGTLIFDEFGKLPDGVQNYFNNLLDKETKSFRPYGAEENEYAKCHFVLTMCESLNKLTKDIKSRLHKPHIVIEPLHKRPEDIIPLFIHFNKEFSKQKKCEKMDYTDGFLKWLATLQWPYNARSVEEFVEKLYSKRVRRTILYDYDGKLSQSNYISQIHQSVIDIANEDEKSDKLPTLEEGDNLRHMLEEEWPRNYVAQAVLELNKELPRVAKQTYKNIAIKLGLDVNDSGENSGDQQWLYGKINNHGWPRK